MNTLGAVEGTASWGVMAPRSVTIEEAKCLDLTVDGVLLRGLLAEFRLEERTPIRSGFLGEVANGWVSQLINPVAGELPDGYASLSTSAACAAIWGVGSSAYGSTGTRQRCDGVTSAGAIRAMSATNCSKATTRS